MKKIILGIIFLIISDTGLGIEVGEKAPDFRAKDWRGREIRLSDSFGKQNVLLVFSRYIGCSWCQMFMLDLHNHRKEIAETKTKVIILNLSPQEVLAKYSPPPDFQFELIPDPERKIYALYGVKIDQEKITGNLIWQSIRFLKYLGSYKYVNRGLEGAHYQVPACFVIGKDGKVKTQHLGKDPADNPKVETLLVELKKLSRD